MIKERLKLLYYLKVKHFSVSDYNRMLFKQAGGKLGDNCYIFCDIRSLETSMITIGENVTISGDVSFCTHDNAICKVLPDKSDLIGEINIGNNCFIGMRSIIMLGVSLGNNCIVGAGSVVTHSFPDNSVIAGNPARYICSMEEYGEKNKEYALNLNEIPFSERSRFFAAHKNRLITKKVRRKRDGTAI